MTARDTLDLRYPGMAADSKRQRGPAIKLFCIECMGGSAHDASTCPTTECRLWPHAYRKGREVALQARLAPLKSARGPGGLVQVRLNRESR